MAVLPNPEHGDPDDFFAIDHLNQNFRSPLLSYFSRRSRSPNDVEDMVQEVFVRLLRRGHVSLIENIGGYVFEIASSVLLDWMRKNQTHHSQGHVSFNHEQHAGVDFSPEHVLLDREQLARVTACLLELPERTRVIFMLRRMEGMKYKAISSRLGISVSAVEKHMQRAITHLGSRLDR